MIIDTHCHVIATDTKTYPLKPLFGKQSDWSAEHPIDHPDMVAAGIAAGVDKSVLVQASSAYAFDNSYVADSVNAHPERFAGGSRRRPAVSVRAAAVAAGGIPERVSQAHPSADRAIDERPVHA